MNVGKSVLEWLEKDGKIWLFRILAVSVLTLGLAEEIDPFGWFSSLKTPVVILAIPAIFFYC